MATDPEEIQHLVHTIIEIAKADNMSNIIALLTGADVKIDETGYDNWDGGTYLYTVNITIDVRTFIALRNDIPDLETRMAEKFGFITRHWTNHRIVSAAIIPKSFALTASTPNPHRPFSEVEDKRRNDLIAYLDKASEDNLIEEVLLPLFRQLGFHRITFAGHKDKALEYGKDIWMRYMLPTQHVLYFGVQVKKGKA